MATITNSLCTNGQQVVLQSGTSNLYIGTTSTASISMGNNGATLQINSSTGGSNFSLVGGNAISAITCSGASSVLNLTAGSINLSTGSSGLKTINIGDDANTSSVRIGSATSVQIGVSASASQVTICNGIGGSTVTIFPGSGGLNISSFTTTGALVSNASGLITDANANTAGYVLTSNGSGSAPSFQAAGSGGIVTLDGSTGSATGSTVSIVGSNSNIVTSATSATLTIALASSPSVSGSITAGTGVIATTGGLTATAGGLTITAGTVTITPFASYGALVSNTSGVVTDAAATAGYVLTGNTGAVPSFQAVSSIGAVIELSADSGSASPASGIIDIAGGSNIVTSGATNVLTVALASSPSVSGSITAGTGVIATTGGLTATAGGLTVTAGTVTITPFASYGALVTNTSGVITDAAAPAGYVLTGNSGSVPTFQALPASPAFWNNVTGSTQAMAVGLGYISNDGATLVTLTLPATAAVGAEVAVMGSGTGLWTVAQNSGQTIHFNAVDSTTGVGGSVSSTSRYDSMTLVCNVANTDWVVYQATGNLSVV